jgi:hypothetical protein
VPAVQEGSYSLNGLDAGSNSARRPVSNKIRYILACERSKVGFRYWDHPEIRLTKYSSLTCHKQILLSQTMQAILRRSYLGLTTNVYVKS